MRGLSMSERMKLCFLALGHYLRPPICLVNVGWSRLTLPRNFDGAENAEVSDHRAANDHESAQDFPGGLLGASNL